MAKVGESVTVTNREKKSFFFFLENRKNKS